MMEIFEALGPDEWAGLKVPHFYMGPLPAFWTQKLKVTVSSGSIALLGGAQLSPVRLEPAVMRAA